jgi:histidinol-phosphate aminotransferase
MQEDWMIKWFVPSLLEAPAYRIDETPVPIKLDQNESPWDAPPELKDMVLAKLREGTWNRYPQPYTPELAKLIADDIRLPENMILTAPGSDYLITLVIDTLSRNATGPRVVLRPTFPLCENHHRYTGLEYQTWNLGKNFEFDLGALPKLSEFSFVIFASPNNPSGSVLKRADLESLLQKNPTSIFVADEAYYEFSGEPYHHLVAKYPNLIVLRTFSKGVGLAGLRFAYLIACPDLLAQLRKVRLPFLLNRFTIEVVKILMTTPEIKRSLSQYVETVRMEREKVREAFEALRKFEVFPSEANFLLVRLPSDIECLQFYQHLISCGIIVRNVSAGPQLGRCLRISIGHEEQNKELVKAAMSFYKK